MRSSRRLRPSRGRQDGLPGPLRAAASRPGKRGHLHQRRRRDPLPEIHGPRGGYLHHHGAGRAAGQAGHRAHALLDGRRHGAAERAAVFGGLQQGPRGGGAQRQHHQCHRTARGAGAARIDLPGQQRHRSDPAPGGALVGTHAGGRAARRAAADRGRIFAGVSGGGPHHRGARSARLPAAGDGPDGIERARRATSSHPRPAPSI